MYVWGLQCDVLSQVSQVPSVLKQKNGGASDLKTEPRVSDLGSATHLWVAMTLRPQLPPIIK